MRAPLWVLLLLVVLLVAGVAGSCARTQRVAADPPPAVAVQAGMPGIGILGDSFYDEYRGTDGRGGEYKAVTFNLVELLVRLRGLNVGEWGAWGEPRRTGYAYNWARSGANSGTLISKGQHTGVAEQIAAGEVAYVFIGIGANDFNPYHGDTYSSIYAGTMSDDELADKIAGAVNNVRRAVDTVQEAGAQGVAITLFTQWDMDPTLPDKYPDAEGRERVAEAIDQVNAGLREMAAERSVAVVDQNAMGSDLLARLDGEGVLTVGGEQIDFLHNGDEPHHVRLADGQHLGTVMGGLTANYYLVDVLNNHFGLEIAPLSEDEILQQAGLQP